MTRGASIHPAAWWCWAIGAATAASSTTHTLVLALLVATVSLVVVTCRGDSPWAQAFRQYLYVAAFVVVTRIVMRIVFGGGDVTTAIAEGATEGLRLGAIIVCVGAANALADTRRLLAAMPGALHEIGTTIVIAMSILPQLADSVQRVRRARRLLATADELPRRSLVRRTRALRTIVVPVLEDAFDRSLELAASMESRGFGRARATPGDRLRSGVCFVVALVTLGLGMYATLDATTPDALGVPMLVVGTVATIVALRIAGRSVHRTRHRPDPWLPRDVAIAASGVAAAIAMLAAARIAPWSVHPDVGTLALPAITPLAIAAIAALALPATLAARTRSVPA
jgi:energy-coupling factor transport system permease protein